MSLLGLSSVSQTGAQAGPTTITECREIDEPGEYVLDDDLSGEGDCLRITASGVTLDGNGHTLDGDGTGTGLFIESSESTVRNLTIQGFETGVRIGFSRNITLSSVTIQETVGLGIWVIRSNDVLCEDSTIRRNGSSGVSLSDYSQYVTVRNCDLVQNRASPVRAGSSAIMSIEDCRIVDNDGPVSFTPMPDSKIEGTLVSGSDGPGLSTNYGDSGIFDDPTPIRNCVVRDCDGAGIEQPHGYLDVRECTLSGNRVGYRAGGIEAYEAILQNNNIEDNEEYGVQNTAPEEETTTIDATCNWWGDESGPVHEDNPNENPQGQRVSDDVEFVPWSTDRIEDDEGSCDGGLDEEEKPNGPPEGGTGYISKKSYLRIKGVGPYEDVDCWGGTVYVTDPSDVEDAGFGGPGEITVPPSSGTDDAPERSVPGHVIRAESDAVPVTLPTWGGDRGACESLLFVDPEQDLRADVEYRIVTDDPRPGYEEVDTGGFAGTIHEIVQVEYVPVRSDGSEEV
ncbi:right-handed parallel beta-helix repeat-containing protein [Halorubrum sp. N11]|uniref:right-handed parallel beta-helix repeat-containing protein n=1 Tax=Halorubrum sp. N11 TaxID=3402276 RepID=UPI003EBAF2E0